MPVRPSIEQIEATGASDGDVPIYDASVGELRMGPPANGIDSVVVTVTGGVPHLMFDADSSPVTTEVPS